MQSLGRWLLVLVCTLAMLVVSVPVGRAADLSRDEYVSQVEPICKANVLANRRIFAGLKGKVKAGRLKPASRHFFRAADAFAKTIRQLAAVPQPTADQARLARWLDLL